MPSDRSTGRARARTKRRTMSIRRKSRISSSIRRRRFCLRWDWRKNSMAAHWMTLSLRRRIRWMISGMATRAVAARKAGFRKAIVSLTRHPLGQVARQYDVNRLVRGELLVVHVEFATALFQGLDVLIKGIEIFAPQGVRLRHQRLLSLHALEDGGVAEGEGELIPIQDMEDDDLVFAMAKVLQAAQDGVGIVEQV